MIRAEILASNLSRWREMQADPQLADLDFRIETNRFGEIILSPPQPPTHGQIQAKVGFCLQSMMGGGRVITECPISTLDGVKAADVAWLSAARWDAEPEKSVCLTVAPEICVEVLSPRNRNAEIAHKKALYFEAGASEVWLCAQGGAMQFFLAGAPEKAVARSARCPDFPTQIEI